MLRNPTRRARELALAAAAGAVALVALLPAGAGASAQNRGGGRVVYHQACGTIANLQPNGHPPTFALSTDRVFQYRPGHVLGTPQLGQWVMVVYRVAHDGTAWARSVHPTDGYCM